MMNLYPSLKPLPKVEVKKPKVKYPTGCVPREVYESRRFGKLFKKES